MFGGSRSTGMVCVASYANVRSQAKQFPPVELYTRDPTEIAAFLKKHDVIGRSSYFAVNTIIEGKTRAKDNVLEITNFHTDLDFKGIVEDRKTVEAVLSRLPMRPSFIVFSGHGLHVYWSTLVTPDMMQRVEAVLKRLCWLLAGDPAAAEIARVLRLPGSHNSKFEGEWIEVEVIHTNDVQYTLEQMEEFVASFNEPLLHKVDKASKTGTAVTHSPFFDVAQDQIIHEPIDVDEAFASMVYQGTEGNGVNLTQFRVIGSMLHDGCQVDEVIDYVVDQTWAAIPQSVGWDKRSEVQQLRHMSVRTFRNHPELVDLQINAPEWLSRRLARHSSAVQWTPMPDEEEPHTVTHSSENNLLKKPGKPSAPLPVIGTYYLEDLRAKPLVQLEWDVADFVLSRQLNSVIGEGAVGKDLLLFQLAVAATSGGQILERDVRQCRVMYFNIEDDDNELRRREENIRNYYSSNQSKTRYRPRPQELMIVPMFGKDTVLAAWDSKSGTVQPRPLYDSVRNKITEFKPGMVIIGNRVNIFSVNQNEDAQARQCLGLLNALCLEFNTTVIMPSHPSLRGGGSEGDGTSGSVQWSNGVRLRSYLSRVITKDDDNKEVEENPNQRMLEVKKSNYSARGMSVVLNWTNGTFQQDPVTLTYPTSDAEARKDKAALDEENEFLRMLDTKLERKINISPDPTSRNGAPTLFSRDLMCKYRGKPGRAILAAAMERLYDKKMIHSVEYGPPSKRHARVERVVFRVVK